MVKPKLKPMISLRIIIILSTSAYCSNGYCNWGNGATGQSNAGTLMSEER